MNVHVDIRAAAELAEAWERAPAMTRHELTAAMWEAELLLQREIQENTPVGATGLLRGSISAREPQVLADQVIGVVGTAIAHAVPVELGTRPHFPPVAALVDWVEQKLGVPAPESERVAFLVARKIAARGTEGAAMFGRAFQANRAQVVRIFEAAFGRIRNRLAEGAA